MNNYPKINIGDAVQIRDINLMNSYRNGVVTKTERDRIWVRWPRDQFSSEWMARDIMHQPN